jgi:inorganic pyrophosphatase
MKKSQCCHLWHSLSVGDQAPHIINGVIEITKGSKAKYELDKETGLLRLDRILGTTFAYPFHYGFVPQTYGLDNDPLDIIILCSEQLVPASIVPARVIGAVEMIDAGEKDDKIIAVAAHDPAMAHVHDIKDLAPATKESIKDFFLNYKKPENKEVSIGEFLSHQQACDLLKESVERYQKHFVIDKV